MDNHLYRLRYLPRFYSDVAEKTSYIADTLSNPSAALRLLDDIESAILERLPSCESYEAYHSSRERRYPYYRIYVRNYVVYYVVIDDDPDDKIMEIRRLLYKRQDRDALI